jgi:diaminopimelate epimerase
MSSINFCKLHGFGNDYIVIESEELQAVENLGEFAKRICHRNTGVGGDGIALLGKSEDETADYSCRIINPDGSEAGFSGNGTRCAVAYLYYKNLFAGENLKLQTKSGIKNYQLLERTENTFWFRAELGKPKFDLRASKFLEEISQDDSTFSKQDFSSGNSGFSLLIKGYLINCTFVDVGNPVAVIFLEDFDQIDWRSFGSIIENYELFPERTNVVFVKVCDRENIEISIWERGAGETSSSGTCSIAAVVASAVTGKTERTVSVRAEGGTTEAVWREDGEMLITGRADLVFCGEWFGK